MLHGSVIKITIHNVVNIGVAVAVPDGLLVPVVNNADLKSLNQINAEVKVAKRQRQKLQPQEMTGNTFTISNLGMFDIEEFTAIINPPDACIPGRWIDQRKTSGEKQDHRGWTPESDPQLRPQGGGWGNRSSIPANPQSHSGESC